MNEPNKIGNKRGEGVIILETDGIDDDGHIYFAGDAAAHNAKIQS